MTQIEYYKRYSEDESKKMSDEDYANAVIFLEGLRKVIKDELNLKQ